MFARELCDARNAKRRSAPTLHRDSIAGLDTTLGSEIDARRTADQRGDTDAQILSMPQARLERYIAEGARTRAVSSARARSPATQIWVWSASRTSKIELTCSSEKQAHDSRMDTRFQA
eukprot:5073625-Pleurochrysis_carterae.AAC.2